MNCSALKDEVFNCLKNTNIGYSSEYLKFRASNYMEHIDKLRINEDIMKKCNYGKLAECLNEKYEIANLSEKKMFVHFNKKYNEEVVKANDAMQMKNVIIKNNDKK